MLDETLLCFDFFRIDADSQVSLTREERRKRPLASSTRGGGKMQGVRFPMSPQNATRLDLLRSAPLNSWVALSQDESRIVAAGQNLDEVIATTHAMGEQDPLILRTPPAWGPIFG
jgi:hypothetical protein